MVLMCGLIILGDYAAKMLTNSSGRLQDSASVVISVIKAAGTVVAFSIAVQVFSKSSSCQL